MKENANTLDTDSVPDKSGMENSRLRLIRHLFIAVLMIGLYFTTRVNYLLFHTLAEFFSIVVAFSVFIITWNSRKYIENQYLILIGIAYLFIAFLDLLHTLTYTGLNIIPGEDFYANQLWIAARFMESLTLFLGFFLIRWRKKISSVHIFVVYMIISALLVVSIFFVKVFPVCYISGVGQTPFKKISEYVIVSILVLTIWQLRVNQLSFDREIARYLYLSLASTIIAELAFTFYISNYGISNLVGHYFKLASFYFIYMSIIHTGLIRPFNLIFREVDHLNLRLGQELQIKENQVAEREKLIGELRTALEEVKTLSDLLPVCMHCRKVRDDQGYWSRIEEYMASRLDTRFSHGLCPECRDTYYPESNESS